MTCLGSSTTSIASIRPSCFHFDSPRLRSCSEEVCCRSSSSTPSRLLLDESEWMRKPSPSPSGLCLPWSPVGWGLFSLWAAQSHWNLALWHWEGGGGRGGQRFQPVAYWMITHVTDSVLWLKPFVMSWTLTDQTDSCGRNTGCLSVNNQSSWTKQLWWWTTNRRLEGKVMWQRMKS